MAFGQSSSSPFWSQPAIGQTSSASDNPFSPKPFGSTSSFGSKTGGSIFGGMSTGVFGAQSSSPLGSNSVFGVSLSPAFGNSTPTFGVSSGSAFVNSSSAFGGSEAFKQKQSLCGFGSNTTQTSPFGSSFQQTLPDFGSNLFGSSTPFGAPSHPAFGSSSTPAFGAPSTPAFGTTSCPAFGSTASPTFGSSSGGFGVSTSPFGSSTLAFGTSSTPAFGTATTPTFGASTTSAFGSSTTPAFCASSTPLNVGSSPAFDQSTTLFGNTPFGTSSLGVQNASFGAQTTTSTFGGFGFGQSALGGQRGGTRLAPYSSTPEINGRTGTQLTSKLESISVMPVYKDKSHEELKWEDYQLGDKGGPAPAGESTTTLGFGTSNFCSATAPAFPPSSATPFSFTTPLNPFAPKTSSGFSSSGFGSSPSTFGSSPLGTLNTSNPICLTPPETSSLFGSIAQAFGVGSPPSNFGDSGTSAFGSLSIFGPTSLPGISSAFSTSLGFTSTQFFPLFQSCIITLTPASSPFVHTSSAFAQAAPGLSQTNLFSTPSTSFGGNTFSSIPSLLSDSYVVGFGQPPNNCSGVFGQKPSFGCFRSNTTQTSPFESSFQQTQPAFGSNLFGSSTPFGSPSQLAFGSSSTPAFGAPCTPAFGASSSPAFGSTTSPTFGSTSGGFGLSTSPFGSSTSAFGTSSTPAFGSTTPAFGKKKTTAFGAMATPAFGSPTTPAFGSSTTPAFGSSTTPAFCASSTPFNVGSSPSFGQSTAVFGSTPFGTSSLGVQSASFGAQTTTSTCSGFGQSSLGGQRGGTRLAPYSSPKIDGATGTQPAGKLEAISAMPVYKDKSHEELRWEDYQLGDKGGPAPAGQSTIALGFGTSSFCSATAPAFPPSSATPFSSTAPSNPFAPKTSPGFSSSGFGSSPSAFGSSPLGTLNTSNPICLTPPATSSLFGSTVQTFGFGSSPSIFGNSGTSAFGSLSIFSPTSSPGTSSAFNTSLGFANTQFFPLFQSFIFTLTPTSSPFAQTSSAFAQTAPGLSQTNCLVHPQLVLVEIRSHAFHHF